MIQADHSRFQPSQQVQICSIQTVARRRWPDAGLIVVDECHAITESVRKRITPRDTVCIGLTATPFTKGLGKLYDAIINVTTTNALIAQGYLSPYRIFSCVEPNMEGVPVVGGEFEEGETEKRALQVVGDVVLEYLKHGQNRKFICSAVNTAHVAELQRQFLSAGINVATYTYTVAASSRQRLATAARVRAGVSVQNTAVVLALSQVYAQRGCSKVMVLTSASFAISALEKGGGSLRQEARKHGPLRPVLLSHPS